MSRGRILILANRVPYPLNDGGNLAMKAMVDGYHANGWEVFLLSMNTKRHYVPKPTLKEIYTDISAFETVDVDNSVRMLQLIKNFFFSSEPEHAQRFCDIQFEHKVLQVLNTFQPDVVQVESLYLHTYLAAIRSNSAAKVVLRLHNIEHQVWQRLAEGTKGLVKKHYIHNLAGRIKQFEQRIWKEYDLLLPITHIDEHVVLETKQHAQTYVVPYGIDINNIAAPTDKEQWMGYHIGAMDWLPNKEGVEWFLQEAWPLIWEKSPGFMFAFAGRNMPEGFKALNLKGVSCKGEVADAQAFIADKRILIVPIHSGGGIRVKVLEAMAAGKVVISTTVGMQGIDARPGVHFLLADTAEAFSQTINWCLQNKAAAIEIANNAKALIISQYNKQQIAEMLTLRLAELL